MLLCFMPHVGTAIVSEHICAYTNVHLTHVAPLTYTSTVHAHIQDLRTTYKSAAASLVWLTEPSKICCNLQAHHSPFVAPCVRDRVYLGKPQTTSVSSCAWTRVGRCCNQSPNHQAISLYLCQFHATWGICLLARHSALVVWTCMLNATNRTFSF